MSNLVVPNNSENILLLNIVGGIEGNVRLGLFKNDYTPDENSIVGNFTPADYNGYAAVTPTFDVPATVAGKATIEDTVVRQFAVTSAGSSNTIYGYYVYLTSDVPGFGRLLWAERFDNEVVLSNVGDKILIQLVFTLFSQF